MQDILDFIDYIFNGIYSVILWYQQNGGIWFYITLIVFFIYPLLARVVRALKKNQ